MSRGDVPAQFFEPYEDIALEVVSREDENKILNAGKSNKEIVELVCQVMGIEEFDLFDAWNFESIYDTGTISSLRAYSFVALLRWEMFEKAAEREIGSQSFNELASAHSEYWHVMLEEKFDAYVNGTLLKHNWIN